ncbi:hypothetical protein D9M69_579740 [compost metagenome]
MGTVAAGHIRFTDSVENFRFKPFTVVLNRDGNVRVGPTPRDTDFIARKIDRIFHQIAKPIKQPRIAANNRLRFRTFLFGHLKQNSKIPMRLNHFLDQ